MGWSGTSFHKYFPYFLKKYLLIRLVYLTILRNKFFPAFKISFLLRGVQIFTLMVLPYMFVFIFDILLRLARKDCNASTATLTLTVDVFFPRKKRSSLRLDLYNQ